MSEVVLSTIKLMVRVVPDLISMCHEAHDIHSNQKHKIYKNLKSKKKECASLKPDKRKLSEKTYQEKEYPLILLNDLGHNENSYMIGT